MSQEGWLALNGGKLIGTNIKPPESDEEIRAWIAERKKRFPTARKRGLVEQEKAEKKLEEEQGKANLVEAKKGEEAREVVQQEAQARKRKREAEVGSSDAQKVASETESGEDDAPPEEISSHTRTVFRDHRRRNLPKKEKPVCKQFQQNGNCSWGEGCKFRHEAGTQKKNKNKKQRAENIQLSLYQKVCSRPLHGKDAPTHNVLLVCGERDRTRKRAHASVDQAYGRYRRSEKRRGSGRCSSSINGSMIIYARLLSRQYS
jgi:rRNA maturation protein Nop10